jgi:hypothetical protein
MTLHQLITAIASKHATDGFELNLPATLAEINSFESRIGFPLPPAFKEFYTLCNGFTCNEDIFRMVPLEEVLAYLNGNNYGKDWYYFAEYMIYSDMWMLRMETDGTYAILKHGMDEPILTHSLHDFLERFLRGNVFDPGGLYDWSEECKQNTNLPPF